MFIIADDRTQYPPHFIIYRYLFNVINVLFKSIYVFLLKKEYIYFRNHSLKLLLALWKVTILPELDREEFPIE